MATQLYSADKETLIRFVKDSAQYILDNADDLVGNNKRQTGFEITIRVAIDCAPVVDLNRHIITANWKDGFSKNSEK